MKLVTITESYKEQIMSYKAEFLQNNDSMDGTAGLAKAESFEKWYSDVKNNASEQSVAEGLVPATTLLGVDESGELLGMIDIRHRLNDHLLSFGGHIGYSVKASQRKKGYATKMLALALIECEKMGMDRVLISCDKDNLASAKTIIKNGGVLENEVADGNGITQRYWVELRGCLR